jgi:septum formation protein
MKIVLASKSKGRREVLNKLGYDFIVDVSHADEDSIKKEDVKELVMELAKLKAETVAKKHSDSITIGADTLVSFKGEKIGQQKDDIEAENTIRKLLGKTHEVYTGICVINTANNKIVQDYEVSRVTLKNVSDETLKEYIATEVYAGKAGAYCITDPEFKDFIEKVEGSVTNIKGMPEEKIGKMIKEAQE